MTLSWVEVATLAGLVVLPMAGVASAAVVVLLRPERRAQARAD